MMVIGSNYACLAARFCWNLVVSSSAETGSLVKGNEPTTRNGPSLIPAAGMQLRRNGVRHRRALPPPLRSCGYGSLPPPHRPSPPSLSYHLGRLREPLRRVCERPLPPLEPRRFPLTGTTPRRCSAISAARALRAIRRVAPAGRRRCCGETTPPHPGDGSSSHVACETRRSPASAARVPATCIYRTSCRGLSRRRPQTTGQSSSGRLQSPHAAGGASGWRAKPLESLAQWPPKKAYPRRAANGAPKPAQFGCASRRRCRG
jgi:hypothetical protein